LFKYSQRLVRPGDDLVVFLGRHCLDCAVHEVFSASPNFRGKYGLTPLFLAVGYRDDECLLKLGADPFVCDSMGRNALFATVWESEDECSLPGPYHRFDSEGSSKHLEEYLKFAGKDTLLALLKGNKSGLDCFQQAKIRGNPLTLKFLTSHFPEETEAAIVPAELLEPLSFVKEIRAFMCQNDVPRCRLLAVGVVHKQQEDSELENFLFDTLIARDLFPPGDYEYQGPEEYDFEGDFFPWREECLGERSAWERSKWWRSETPSGWCPSLTITTNSAGMAM